MRKLKLGALVKTAIMQLLKVAGRTYVTVGVIVVVLHDSPMVSGGFTGEPVKTGLFLIFGGVTTLLLWEVLEVTDD